MSATPYIIDYRRATYREFMTERRSFLMYPLVMLLKLSRNHMPGSTDDLPFPSLAPFLVTALPQDLQQQINSLEAELVAQRFHNPVRHLVVDPINRTTTVLVAFLHPSGAIGRVHLRVWTYYRPPSVKLFAEIISLLPGGGFLLTLSGKPDMITPNDCTIQRDITATGKTLLSLHMEHPARRSTLPIRTTADLMASTEKLQKKLWDFHTARGVFRPPTPEEIAVIRRGDEITAPKADGSLWRYPAELHQIELLQNRKSSWTSAAWLLAISLGLFLFIGRGTLKWTDYLSLVPILFFHELGHYLAMKVFGYKNLKMFFIPFVGAAVTGKNYNILAWKQSIVFLMGPLPGIILGALLGITAIHSQNESLLRFATFTIFINGFNLFPILPLDGGRIMHALLFSRHPVADVTCRVIAGIVLIIASFYLGHVLLFLGLLMLMGLPALLRLARVAQELRRSGIAAMPTPGQTMPPELAETILDKLIAATPKIKHPRLRASNALSIFEKLNARPPGWLGTTTLLTLHGLALGAAIFFGATFIRARASADADLLNQIDGVQLHAVPPEGAQRFPSSDGIEPLGPHISVIATLNDPESLRLLCERWQPSLKLATVTTFGDTFAITLPPDYARWGDDLLQSLRLTYKNVYIEDAAHDSRVKIEGVAPDESTARAIVDELEEYLMVSNLHPAIASPWSIGGNISEALYLRSRTARRTYARIVNAVVRDYDSDPQLAPLLIQIQSAPEKNDQNARRALSVERDAIRMRLQQKELESLRTDPTIDREFLESYLAIPHADSFSISLPDSMMDRLGLLPSPLPASISASNAHGGWAIHFEASVQMVVTVPNFCRAVPAITQWLHDRGMSKLRYQPLDPEPFTPPPAK